MAQKNAELADKLKAEVATLKDTMPAVEQQEREAISALDDVLSRIPNIPLDDVPTGKDEHDNVVARVVGEKPRWNHPAKEHFEIGEALGMMDFDRASKLSGSRFTVLTGQLAKLERALGQFMIDLHTTEHGYTEVSSPLMVRDEAMYGTGQLPKFAEDLFKTTDGRWLIPTAEVTLTNLVSQEILDQKSCHCALRRSPRPSDRKPGLPVATRAACCASTSSGSASWSRSPMPKARLPNMSG